MYIDMKHKRLLLSGIVAIVGLLSQMPAMAINVSYYAAKSALSEGHWVKVKVTGNGMHEITYEQLKEWGFSDPSKVGVYGYSVPRISDHVVSSDRPDDLPATAVYHGDNSLLFYAEADYSVDVTTNMQLSVQRNLGDLVGYYFLSDVSATSDEIRVINRPTNDAAPLTTHTSYVYIEPEENNPINMGALFFSNPIDTDGRVFNLPIKGWSSNTDARLYYNYVGTTENTVNGPIIDLGDDVSITGGTIGTLINNMVLSPYNKYGQSNTGVIRIRPKENEIDEINVKIARPDNEGISYFALDNLSLVYTRDNSMSGLSQLQMNFTSGSDGTPVLISNAKANTQVWNVTNRFDIGAYTANYNVEDGSLEFVLDKTGEGAVIAFDPEGNFPGVEYVGTVDNQDLHSLETPDMVIITTSELKAQAEKIASLHRRFQEFDVAVVDQQAIFNEFSSGARSVDGYRRFMKMLYDRDKSKFKYLLLLGSASFDNRGVAIDASTNLLTYPAERFEHACNTSVCYSADSFFGMLDDGLQLSNITTRKVNIGVGRIPTNDVASIEKYINKIGEYFENPPLNGSCNQAFLLTCDGDDNSHLLQGDSLSSIIKRENPAVNVMKGFQALYKNVNGLPKSLKQAYAEAFARGVGYFVYAGHSSGARALRSLMSVNEVPSITFGASPMTLLLSCDLYSFDNESNDMSRELLFTPSGPTAVVGATRSVYQLNNIIFGEAFTGNYYSETGGKCISDVYNYAFNQTNGASESQRKNNLCYGLAGDPALPIYRTTGKVMVSEINGVVNEGSETIAINPLEPVVLSGTVCDADGQIDSGFNGDLFINLYEAPETKKTLLQASGDSESLDIVVDEKLLGVYVANVISGQWKTTIVAPEPVITGVNNRMTLYARSTDNVTAAGVETAAISIGQTRPADGIQDMTPPIIDEMYLNSKAFVDGSIVGKENVLYATILPDESGINFSSSIIGGSTRLILDGNRSFADAKGAMSYNSDGSISLKYNINGLSDGRHILELVVADNAGNHASRRVAFNIVENATVNLVADASTARGNVEFSLEQDLGLEDFIGRIYVENAAGQTVFTRDNCTFPFEWNGKDGDGKQVPDGTYRVYATVKSGSGLLTSTPRCYVTVIAPRD